MKKVMIATFVWADNYGAMLQAYALEKFLRTNGYEAQLLNYRDKTILRQYRLFRGKSSTIVKSIKLAVSSLRNLRINYRRRRAFFAFRKEKLHMTDSFCSAAEAESLAINADALICGSDQIWNPQITNGLDDIYSLNFGNCEAKRIAYAASIGINAEKVENKHEFASKLKKLDYISVREKEGKTILQEVLKDRNIVTTVDPVFLCDRKAWEQDIQGVKVPKEKYILIYFLDEGQRECTEIARELSIMTGMRIIHFRPHLKGLKNSKSMYSKDPFTFAALIQNAEVVVTSSFHALAMSLIFHREFWLVPHKQTGTRTLELLEMVGCKDRIVENVLQFRKRYGIDRLDFAEIDRRLEVERVKSAKWLLHCLENQSFSHVCGKQECTGCTACMHVCPQGAIYMYQDVEGFFYPKIIEDKCVNCGKCKEIHEKIALGIVGGVCNKVSQPEAYAVRIKDKEVQYKSSSGGVFTALSDAILDKGGAVACSVYDYSTHCVRYELIRDKITRHKALGSKYIQSIPGDIFTKCCDFLKDNSDKPLLFVGMGCQAAAFRSFSDKLGFSHRVYIVDIICYGSPSPGVWKDYVEYLEGKYRGKIEYVNFKDKENGWLRPKAYATIAGKKVGLQSYVSLFYQNVMLRPSCHTCRYATLNRTADLTIGDFWGIEKAMPEFYDRNGNSLVLVSTQQGRMLLEMAGADLEMRKCVIEKCIQPALEHPAKISPSRERFWQDYRKGIRFILKRYTKSSLLRRIYKSSRKPTAFRRW